MIQNKHIFITGGTGFIASHIIERLISQNKITLYDTGDRNALQFCSFKDHDNLTLVKGDVLDKEQLKKAVDQSNATIFIHMAALAGVAHVIKNPTKTFNVNFMGTYNLLESIKDKKVDHFIDFSTSEVYGTQASHVTEDSPTIQGPLHESRWNYAISKLASELLSFSYYKEFGLPVSSVRPFNVYGPRQVGGSAMKNFITKAINGEKITITGDGSSIRAWCYVSDFVDGIIALLSSPESIGHTFNLGNPQAVVSTKELAKQIIQSMRSSSVLDYKTIDYPDVVSRIPNIDKAKKMLGFAPTIGLSEGIERTVQWFTTHKEKLL